MMVDVRTLLRRFLRRLSRPGLPGVHGNSTAFWMILGLTVVLSWSVWFLHPLGSGRRHLVADMDAYFHSWNLWWVYRALAVEWTNPYFTTYGGYPHGVSLTYHSLILPLGVLSIPLFLSGWTAGQVFLAWHYVYFLTGYLAMFALLNRLRAPPAGCAAAGLFFVMNPLLRNNLARPDSTSFVLFPIVLLCVLRLRRGSFVRVFLAGAAGAVVLLMSPYYGLGLGVLWLLGFFVRSRVKIPFLRYLLVGPLMLLFSSFEWVPQVTGSPPPIPYHGPVPFRLSSFLYPSADLLWVQALEPWIDLPTSATGFFHQSLYLGAIPLTLVVVAIVQRWGELTRWCLLMALVFLLLGGANYVVIGREDAEHSFTLFSLAVEFYEPLKAFRGPRRFIVFSIFFGAAGLGFFRGWRTRWRGLLFLLLAAEILSLPLQHVQTLPPVEELRAVRREIRAPALVAIPLRSSGSGVDYGQTIHGKKLPMAPVTHPPVDLRRFLESNRVLRALYRRNLAPEEDLAEDWEELRRLGYGGVLLHCDPFTREQDYWVRLRKPSWTLILPSWRRELRERFGPPVLSSEDFELYRFPDASPGEGSSDFVRSQSTINRRGGCAPSGAS